MATPGTATAPAATRTPAPVLEEVAGIAATGEEAAVEEGTVEIREGAVVRMETVTAEEGGADDFSPALSFTSLVSIFAVMIFDTTTAWT